MHPLLHIVLAPCPLGWLLFCLGLSFWFLGPLLWLVDLCLCLSFWFAFWPWLCFCSRQRTPASFRLLFAFAWASLGNHRQRNCLEYGWNAQCLQANQLSLEASRGKAGSLGEASGNSVGSLTRSSQKNKKQSWTVLSVFCWTLMNLQIRTGLALDSRCTMMCCLRWNFVFKVASIQCVQCPITLSNRCSFWIITTWFIAPIVWQRCAHSYIIHFLGCTKQKQSKTHSSDFNFLITPCLIQVKGQIFMSFQPG